MTGPRPSADFPAVDPTHDFPAAVELIRRIAAEQHPYDAVLLGMAADVLNAVKCSACDGTGTTYTPGHYVPGEQFVEPPTGPDMCGSCRGTGRRAATPPAQGLAETEATYAIEGRDETCPSCHATVGTSLAYVLEEHTSSIEDGPGSENPPTLCGGSDVAVHHVLAATPPAPEGEAPGFPYTPNYEACVSEQCGSVWSGPSPRPKVCPECGGPAIGASSEGEVGSGGTPGGLNSAGLIAATLRRWGADLREEAGEQDRAARFVGIKLDVAAEAVELLAATPPAPSGAGETVGGQR